jgi:hypothetical protein
MALLILQFALVWTMARPVRLERTTCGFEVRRSIQLSYGRIGVSEGTRTLDHWGHNPVLYPTELHSPFFSFQSGVALFDNNSKS